ncbi:MAG: Gfo/Idh/MocA family oxidoreductase [Anaerolineae bacterium]|nr:Gfo/Idh/MocA family oxidoreductase [Anaerolineae bacterium]
MSPISLLVVGAGSRGSTYAGFAEIHPDRAKVVGVAEPRATYRQNLVDQHHVVRDHVFVDWREAAARPRLADAVIIATQDHMHVEPAIAFADLGYDILLEKPMAPNAEGCRQIVEAVKRNGVLLGVCHVLRYTNFTRRLKELVAAGAIGDLVGIERLEPVGFWHMAHSFVRGNWRNEAESGPMLLTKACHDIDWIAYVMGAPCEMVSSFGTLKHFRAEEAPPGAADRCLDCAVEPSCPYSAKRIYLEVLRRGHRGWPVDVLSPNPTEASILSALRDGPYGRCVYKCDNDVVDHQVVSMRFAGGRTATFTMMAFTKMAHRKTEIFGTQGQLTGDGRYIHHYDFLTDASITIDTEADTDAVLTGHGGGDFGLMDAFVRAVAEQDPSHILSGPDETLASHLLVFAAEEARRTGHVVRL